jgi:hypothetical protein
MQGMIASSALLCAFSVCGQVNQKHEDAVFKVELVASVERSRNTLWLAPGRGFVNIDNWKISEKGLKSYLMPNKKNKDKCVLYIVFHPTDEEVITLEYLFKNIAILRKLRDKNLNTYIYIDAGWPETEEPANARKENAKKEIK